MKLKFGTGDIRGLDNLKWEDQEKIRDKIENEGFDNPDAPSSSGDAGEICTCFGFEKYLLFQV